MQSFFQKNNLIFFFLISVICILAYAPFLYTTFLNDDILWLNIIEKKRESSLYYLSVFNFEKEASFERFYTPLSLLVFDVFDRISNNDPSIIRFFCILIHAFNSYMIYLLLLKRFRSHTFIACLGSILFSVMTIHSQAIIWICNLHDTFGISCALLLFYVYFSKNMKYAVKFVLCCSLIIAGLCVKETFIITPYALIFLDIFIFKRKLSRTHICFIVLSFTYLFFKIIGYQGLGGYDQRGFHFLSLEYCFQIFKDHVQYLFFPLYTRYTFFLSALLLSYILILSFSKKIFAQLKIMMISVLFIFPIILSGQILCGRYFYTLTPFYVLGLCSFNKHLIPHRMKYYCLVCSLLILILVNIFILQTEIPVYEMCSDIVNELNINTSLKTQKSLFFHVPFQVSAFFKPSPIKFYPAAGFVYYYHPQYKRYNIRSFDNIGDNCHTQNKWEYDPESKDLTLFPDDLYSGRTLEKPRTINIKKYLILKYKVYAYNKERGQMVMLK